MTTQNTQSLVPQMIIVRGGAWPLKIAAWLSGIVLLALSAKIAIPLPWTPVPFTGQTFGVMLIALIYGGALAPAVVTAYLALGAGGLPMFAFQGAGLVWGPTLGYLAGMFLASIVVGRLADRGWSKNFGRAYLACLVGSVLVFSCGLAVLSRFVASNHLLTAGLWPFIPGDIIKTAAAAALASQITRFKRAA